MISVIVPVYNGERTIEACLGSITAQQGADLEILVIDDGSTDATRAICRRLSARDPRIRLVCRKHAGVSAARNLGLEMAKGSHITFVDADDLLPPGALENLWEAARAGRDFVIGSHLYFGNLRRKPVIHSPADSLDALLSLMCGKLYSRAIMEENNIRFQEGLPYGEDTVFNLQYHAAAPKTAVLPNIVYHCRMGGAASSLRYYPNRAEIAGRLLEAYRDHCGEGELERIAQRELTETVMHHLVHCPIREAREKTEKAWEILSPFLPERKALTVEAVLRRRWPRILLRKMKKRIKGCGL